MTRDERIAELQRQRQEINRQIREAKRAGEVVVDGARIARRQTTAYRPEEWTLAVEVGRVHQYSGTVIRRFVSLYSADTKEECIEAIPGIIGVLNGLYEAATKGGTEG